MLHEGAYSESAGSAGNAARLGFWAALFTAVSAIAALGIAATTAPPRSGPFCMAGQVDLVDSCVTYPYTDVAAFVPNDYMWMYPAFLMALLFVVLAASIHNYVPAGKRVFSQVALSFAVISAAAHAVNYFIQLAVVQPSLLRGEVEGLTLWSQYNPHGIFIALEDVGYLTMGVAFVFIAAALGGRGWLARIIRYLFAVGGVLAVGALAVLAIWYGMDLEYRYEVAAILIDWLTLIFGGALLGVFFWRARPKAVD